MIQLYRGDAPAKLLANRGAWTERWKRIRAEGSKSDWATADAKKAIRPALGDLSFGKCAFCETRLDVSAHLEIEHHTAKTVEEDLAFEWANLFPACRRCNGAKGDLNHQGGLLKPDAEDPEPYFFFDVDSGKLEPHPGLDEENRKRAQASLDICQLNRGSLCQSRVETYRMVRALLAQASQPQPAEAMDALRDMLQPHREYKLTIRFGFENSGQPGLAKKDRQNFRNGR